jgi:tRNA 2-thiouridine synthesizing protein C
VNTRRFLFLLRRPPQGGVIDSELFDQMLTLAAFDQAITVLFVDDGVYRLTRETGEPVPTMEPAGLLELLAFYDIESIWVEEESLVQRDMNLDEARLSVRTILREDVAGLLASHDVILGD